MLLTRAVHQDRDIIDMVFRALAQWINERNPLWFLLTMGIVLHAVYTWQYPLDRIQYEIRLTSSDVDQIERQLGLQLRRSPSDSELHLGIAQHIHNEALYREALALGLHLSDEVVRRRLVQIMTFLQEDTSHTEPEDDELREYYNSNLDDYRRPARLTLRHLFFSTDRRVDARADAKAALSELHSGNKETNIQSDPFIAGSQFSSVSIATLERQFGSEFSAYLTRVSVGQWYGPITSEFGWHLVFVDERRAERLQPYDEIQLEIAKRWRQHVRDQGTRDRIKRLTKKYHVAIDGEPWTDAI
jgi:hypothetical protein